MVRKTALTMCLMACCGWCLTIVAGDDGESGSPAFKPVASVPSLMNAQFQQMKKIGKLIRDENAKDRKKGLFTAAEVMAELSNVNTFNNTKADYRNWATQLRNAATELSREANGNADNEKMKAIVGSMKEACGACHDVYQ